MSTPFPDLPALTAAKAEWAACLATADWPPKALPLKAEQLFRPFMQELENRVNTLDLSIYPNSFTHSKLPAAYSELVEFHLLPFAINVESAVSLLRTATHTLLFRDLARPCRVDGEQELDLLPQPAGLDVAFLFYSHVAELASRLPLVIRTLKFLLANKGKSVYDMAYIARRSKSAWQTVQPAVDRFDALDAVQGPLTAERHEEVNALTKQILEAPVRLHAKSRDVCGRLCRSRLSVQDASNLGVSLRNASYYSVSFIESVEDLAFISRHLVASLTAGFLSVDLFEQLFADCQQFMQHHADNFSTSQFAGGLEELSVYKKLKSKPNFVKLYVHQDEDEDADRFVNHLEKPSDDAAKISDSSDAEESSGSEESSASDEDDTKQPGSPSYSTYSSGSDKDDAKPPGSPSYSPFSPKNEKYDPRSDRYSPTPPSSAAPKPEQKKLLLASNFSARTDPVTSDSSSSDESELEFDPNNSELKPKKVLASAVFASRADFETHFAISQDLPNKSNAAAAQAKKRRRKSGFSLSDKKYKRGRPDKS